MVPDGVDIRPDRARVGDVVIVSGDIGVHGVAVMSVREGLEFGTEIRSDCAPLNGLVAAMLAVTQDLHVLRDPTRGGVATSLNEIAKAAGVGIALDERTLPDPRGGRQRLLVPRPRPAPGGQRGQAARVRRARATPTPCWRRCARTRSARNAAVIGECVEDHPGMVSARTGFGASRVVDLPIGEQLPRIC